MNRRRTFNLVSAPRTQRRRRGAAGGDGPRLRFGSTARFGALPPLLLLSAFLALAPHAPARQGDDCAAPEEIAARAESLSAQWKLAPLREALDAFARARACFNRAGMRREEALALKRAGDIRLALGEYAQAVGAYDAALDYWRASGDKPAEGHALVDLSRALLFTARHDEALRSARQAAAVARALGDRRLEARAENTIAKYHYRRGEYEQSAAGYERALELAREAADAAEEALALYGAGQVHGDAGELTEALGLYRRALPLWRAAGDRQSEVRTLNSIGLAYLLLGESQTALEYLDREALPALREAGDLMGEAAAHNNIGSVHQSLGDYETALSHHRAALALYDQTDIPAARAVTSVYVGDLLALLGRAGEAQQIYGRALALAKEASNALLEAEVLNSTGALLLAGGDADGAYKLFREALAAYERGKYGRGQAAALNNIGWYFGGRGDWREAAASFRRALSLFRAAGDRQGESVTLYNVARAELELGDERAALASVEAGLRLTESLRAKIAGGDLRSSYFASAHRQFELHVNVLMRLHAREGGPGHVAAAFEASERGRARVLLETLNEARADIRRGVDPELLRRERELQLRLNAKAERLAELKGGGDAAAAEAEREIVDLTAEYRRIQGRVRAASPRYGELVQPAPLTLAEIQREVLDADTVLLEYALGEKVSYAWAVTHDSIRSFALPARAAVEQTARRLYELLDARNRRPRGETWAQAQARVRRAEAEYEEVARELSRTLLGPVAAELRGKRLLIVADGALHYVPFGALHAPAHRGGGQAVPLIAEHEVVHLPSASVLAQLRRESRHRRPAPNLVAVFADPVFDFGDERLASARRAGSAKAGPNAGLAHGQSQIASRTALKRLEMLDGGGIARLPFSRREAEAIMASVPAGEGMLATGFRANRAAATGPELSRYRIIHFATHGLLNGEHPELSGVVLSLYDEAGRRQDGFLLAHEIYNLDLAADLVVLSACRTALGKEIRGEGLVGLTRGFMYAGASRVVASLWKVDDAATAELMGEFYRAMLVEGQRPAAALRAAKVRMMSRPRRRPPYYWAGFTLQGEWK